jgi:hypothetical protein
MRLAGLACGSDGEVWAAGDAIVRQHDRNGNPLSDFELERAPWSIGFDPASRGLWLGFEGEVVSYSPTGQRLSSFRDESRLGRITAIKRVDDLVIVGDAGGRCLRAYTLDGRWLRDIGNKNRTQGLLIPNGVVDFDVDRRTNTLLAANPAKHRVERYTVEGELLGFWGHFGMHDDVHFSGCCNPTNIAVADDGNVLVTEKAPPRVKQYAADGRLIAATAKGELFNPQAKNMCLAAANDRVYVADTARLAVLVLERKAESASPDAVRAAPATPPLVGVAP